MNIRLSVSDRNGRQSNKRELNYCIFIFRGIFSEYFDMKLLDWSTDTKFLVCLKVLICKNSMLFL